MSTNKLYNIAFLFLWCVTASTIDMVAGIVFCPEQPSENFCDCEGDCTEEPSFCECPAAQECCGGEGVRGTISATWSPEPPSPGTIDVDAGIVFCPEQPLENFCDCEGDCTEEPSFCKCPAAQECCGGEGVRGTISATWSPEPPSPTATPDSCPTVKPTIKKIGGKTYASCEGKYRMSADSYNGKPIWDRTDGVRFAFFDGTGKWGITGSQWRADFVGQTGHMGAFVFSVNKASDFLDAGFPGEETQIIGKTYASCQGTYSPTKDLFNGKPIWNRSDGTRFAFIDSDCRWAITGSQWRADFVGQTGHMGAFVTAQQPTQSFNDAWFPGETQKIPQP